MDNRKIDALVAEHLFQRKVLDTPGCYAIGGEMLDLYWKEKPHVYWEVPHYSTDIAAAWEVVEKLSADGWQVTLYVTQIPNLSGTVMYRSAPNDHVSLMKVGIAPPIAICLAALKAKGVTLDE